MAGRLDGALGLVRVVSEGELQRQDRTAQAAAQNAAHEANNQPVLQGIAKYVTDRWYEAKQAKQAVLPRLQSAQRARLGEYSPQKLAEIREYGGSEVYLRVISNKCRTLEAWLKDVYLMQTEKPWTLSPTPSPTVPDKVTQEVQQQLAEEAAAVYAQLGQMPDDLVLRAAQTDMQEAAEQRLAEAVRKSTHRMERKMEDQLVEGGFLTAMAEFLTDFSTYPAAIMCGPVLRKRPQLAWKSVLGGKTSPVLEDTIVPEFDRVDPFRAFPAPGAATPQDGYFIEHKTLAYDELYALLGSPGVNDEALRAALYEAENGGLHDWLGFTLESDKPQQDAVSSTLRRTVFNIDVLLFYGPVKGQDLIDWGSEDDIPDPAQPYEAAVWLVGRWVVKAHLNYDPLGSRPYYKASYETLPGEFWGEGPPDILSDVGDVVHSAGRAMVNNMAMASGPQVGINIDRLPAGEDVTNLVPWRVWQFGESQFNSSTPAIDFFQPNMHASELLGIIEKFYQLADDFSLIPRYLSGSSPVAGAGRTASGLSMLMDAAYKGMKAVVTNIDIYVIERLLRALYNFNMQFDSDETLKGDAQVVARGAVSLMQMESLQLRRNEFLQATNNPTDQQIIGPAGRAEVLREVAKGLEMDTTRIIPSREQLSQQAPPAMPTQEQPPQTAMNQEQLANGAAVTDNFSPNAMTPQP